MKLTQIDLSDIDDLARLYRDSDQKFYPHRQEDQPIEYDHPGLLNLWRAFHMLWKLGSAHVSLSDAEATLRENWPEAWRTNESRTRFSDQWFYVLADHALNEHRLRKTSLHPAGRLGGTEETRDHENGKRTCLIVDDDPMIRKYFSILVEQGGFEVCGVAQEGQEAIDKAIALKPAIVLMAVRLPGDIDGIEAARIIRRRLDTRMIFVSGADDRSTLDRISKDERAAVLIKPVSPEDLSNALRW